MRLSLNRLLATSILALLVPLLVALTGCQTTESSAEFQDYDPGVFASPAQTNETGEATEATATAVVTPAAPAETKAHAELSDTFRVGDVVAVTFSGTSEDISPHQERIKEDGTITLSLVGPVVAAGKTPGELQKELQQKYNKYYKTLVVTVQSFQRYYYVGGEVKRPGAQEYIGETTVTKAIQAAGDFTDFAKKTKVRVIRADGTTLKVNVPKAINDPSLDPPIYPGDKIHVPRRIFF